MTKPAAPPRLGEFERIARFFAPLAGPGALALKDDVALIDGPGGNGPGGEQYVITTDAIVEGLDYFPDDPPFMVAQKLLRVNLSDLAAKGATPFGYLLTTALPASHGEVWLEQFTAGLAADQKEYGIVLLGGDSSGHPGPALLSAVLIGKVAAGKAILRSGGHEGDTIYVSGTIGDSALGLALRKGESLPGIDEAARDYLIDRYRLPRPRVVLGPKLIGLAHAMLDISDGLIADLGHLCAGSNLGAVIHQPRIPLSSAGRAAVASNSILNTAVTGGGDDYELLFAAQQSASDDIVKEAAACGVPVAAIGTLVKGEGVTLLDAAGQAVKVERSGYAHF